MLKVILFLAGFSSSTGVNLPPEQMYCVAKAVYTEARGEPVQGQVAVAWGVKNRVQSPDFPNTPCAVIYEKNKKGVLQFSGINEIKIDESSTEWDSAVQVAVLSWSGYVDDPIDGNRFWYAPRTASVPSELLKNQIKIGGHIFYDYKKTKTEES